VGRLATIRGMTVKTPLVRRSLVLFVVACVAFLAAIDTLPHPASIAATSAIDDQHWSIDSQEVSTGNGGAVSLSFTDPFIKDGRYIIVDKLHFPGLQGQTIDTGIVLRDKLHKNVTNVQPNILYPGFAIEANTVNVVGSGYIWSTSGVYSSTGSQQLLLPRYGVYYGFSSGGVRDGSPSFSSTRTVMSNADGSDWPSNSHTQTFIRLPLLGTVSSVIQNPDGSSFYENRYINPPTSTNETKYQETTGITRDTTALGDGTILIGGVGGACLGNVSNCDVAWLNDAKFRTDYTSSNSNYYRASMFFGDIKDLKITGDEKINNVDKTLFDGVPAFDLLTGYCGFYDTVTAQFIIAENPDLVTCTPPSVTLTSGTPGLTFTYLQNHPSPNTATCLTGQNLPAGEGCFTMTAAGTLGLSFPILPDTWLPGMHHFQVEIRFADEARTIDFDIVYMPPGTLTLVKRAWQDVPADTSYDDILDGEYVEIISDESASPPVIPVLSSDTSITFTFTAEYVVHVDGVPDSDFTGRAGLTDVSVTDDVLNADGSVLCVIDDLLVNTPVGCTSDPWKAGTP